MNMGMSSMQHDQISALQIKILSCIFACSKSSRDDDLSKIPLKQFISAKLTTLTI